MESDDDLLARYHEDRDQAAFAALFDRHSAMVQAVCRRVLGFAHPHLEDACQATFIVLARKAGTLRRGRTLAGWLHHVARAAALNVVRSETRRHAHEKASSSQIAQKSDHDESDHAALLPHLDVALDRLSNAQKEVVVRHFMERKPQAVVAGELGISEGAVKKRVADAVAKLREFFSRRGFAVTGAGLIAALSLEAPAASSSVSFNLPTILAVGSGGDNPATIAQEVLKSIAVKKFSLAGLALAAALVVGGIAVTVERTKRPGERIFQAELCHFAADPTYGAVGFTRGHWATSINKALVFLAPGSSTSVRAFDPVSNTWEYLWPENTLGVQGRYDGASYYVPRLDELWVWNGSYISNHPGALSSGRFHVSQKKWLATGVNDSDAFKGVVDMSATGTMPFSGLDPAMAWAESIDTGLMFRAAGGNTVSTFIFEPKAGGPEPYQVTRFNGPQPPFRSECENGMVSDGKDFYLFGGYYQEPNDPVSRQRKDLWKFDTATRTWSELPPPPDVAVCPVLTYDSDLDVLVAWVKDRIYVYDIAAKKWSDQTPPGVQDISNQLGVYCPTAKVHIFEGGNLQPAGANPYTVFGCKLSGLRQ